MFKKTLFSVLGVLLVFFISLKLSTKIQDSFLYITDHVKIAFIYTQATLADSFSKHFAQVKQISELNEKVKNIEKTELELARINIRLEALREELNAPKFVRDGFKIVQTISYVNMGDYSKIWIDYEMKDKDGIVGLIQKGYAAGIVVAKNNRALGLLNGDPRCSYAVFVGEDKAPGMFTGRGDEEKLYIEFIPSWKDIKINDEVVTSGLDGIFFEGIRVGYVTEIEENQGYKIAKIKSYANTLSPKYFWIKEDMGTVQYIENNITE